MEKGLRISYFVVFPIVFALLYLALKREGNMAMGVLAIFLFTSIPFILIHLNRSLKKMKKILVNFPVFQTN